MPYLEFKKTIDSAALRSLIGFPSTMAKRVLPDAVMAASAPIREKMEEVLPDSDLTGTRKKQSKSARQRWPYKLNKQVATRVKSDIEGSLAITGVRSPEGQYVRIDFDKKARTTGRQHILWGKRPAKIPYRIQKLDVVNIVWFAVGTRVQEIFEANIKRSITSGKIFQDS